jgi:DnaJ-class molecular chaperone
MPFKKIEDMDFYEILGLNRDATPGDIAEAHLAAVSAYAPGALASYGLVSEEERTIMLERIEKAFRTLGDPETRTAYDEDASRGRSPSPHRAVFRKSVQPLEIQAVRPPKSFGERIRGLFRRRRRED